MNEIKVSVIIYVKNTIDYIEKCVRSVMEQSLQEIEILVIDGGSTDGTLGIIEKLKQSDSRIRLFHSSASVGSQFNLGLREARGRYIGICEADDYILPEMYERQYRLADENRLDVIRGGYYQIFNIEDREYQFKLKSCYQDEFTEKVMISKKHTFFLEQGINGFWNGIYRRQFLLDNQIWMNETEGAAYQDISFSFLTQLYAERIWFMKDAFYCYRIDNPNASVNSLRGIELHIKEYEELKKRLKIQGLWEEYKNMFFSWELISYRWFLGELPRELKSFNAEKIYCYLREQGKEEQYDENKVMETVRDLAEALLCSKSTFTEDILSETDNAGELLEYIDSYFRNDKTIILFGAGHIGNILKQFLYLCNKEVFMMDNNTLLQQHGMMGEAVYKPEELVVRFPYGRYIIANVSHAVEMKEQLLKLGAERRNILICDNEEFF